MHPCCGERGLFYALLVFWLVGFCMLVVQHPYNCKFFDLPANARSTGHADLKADWFYNFTHRLTLTPYAIICCLLQLGLFTFWYAQLASHEQLQARIAREVERGRQMREAGWLQCFKTILHDDEDDEEHAVDPEVASPPRHRGGFRCVCGCCYLFSTDFGLLFANTFILHVLVYLLLLGYGTLESTSRFTQNLECRSALPTGIYLFTLNGALFVLYVVLLIVRVVCGARTLARGVVAVSRDIRERVAQRGGLNRGRGSKYAQIGHGGLGDADDIELDLDEEPQEDPTLGMESFLDEEEVFDDPDGNELELAIRGSSSHAPQSLAQPKPHRPAHMLAGPPSASPTSSPTAPNEPDEDTREMLEMLGASEAASQVATSRSPPTRASPLITTSASKNKTPRIESSEDELPTGDDAQHVHV